MKWFKRCFHSVPGPLGTEWRCLLSRKHDGEHIFEPDLWGVYHAQTPQVSPEVIAQARQDRLADDAEVARQRSRRKRGV